MLFFLHVALEHTTKNAEVKESRRPYVLCMRERKSFVSGLSF